MLPIGPMTLIVLLVLAACLIGGIVILRRGAKTRTYDTEMDACPSCGAENRRRASYCASCGAPIPPS